MTKWQAVHKQDKTVFIGSEQEVLDKDQRLWIDKKPVLTKIVNTPMAMIVVHLNHNPAMYCMAGVFVLPVYNHKQLSINGIDDNYWVNQIKIVKE